MVAAGLVEAGDEVRAPGSRRATAHPELPGELRLARGGERGALFMADADPVDLASPHGVRERIERVSDQPEDVPDADALQRIDQYFRHGQGHIGLLCAPAHG